VKKLINSILKHFSLQLVKRPKQRKRGWKQQGRGTRVTVSNASDPQNKMFLLASTAPTRLKSQAPHDILSLNSFTKYGKIPKGRKQGVPVWRKDK